MPKCCVGRLILEWAFQKLEEISMSSFHKTVSVSTTFDRSQFSNVTRMELNAEYFVGMKLLPVSVHLINMEGTILWANDAELHFLGYTSEEYCGKNLFESVLYLIVN
jgi:hypothetical protein